MTPEGSAGAELLALREPRLDDHYVDRHNGDEQSGKTGGYIFFGPDQADIPKEEHEGAEKGEA
jgi:hypothetical protein